MSDGIFLIQSDGKLLKMKQTEYELEAKLQELIAKYPDLLSGDQINSQAPRRWLLIGREIGIPSLEGASDRWSLDHLFLDQDGIPTFVEVKRNRNPQVRREVTGQILEYAAFGVAYWKVDTLRDTFEKSCQSENKDPLTELENFLRGEISNEEFWAKVKTNLQTGKIRLLFVADSLPYELRMVIKFLNQQMNPAEVLAVEIPQFATDDKSVKTYVPRVSGQVQKQIEQKIISAGNRGSWDEQRFMQEIEKFDVASAKVAKAILDWAKNHARLEWGTGTQRGTFIPKIVSQKKYVQLFTAKTTGDCELTMGGGYYNAVPPFTGEKERAGLIQKLNHLLDNTIPDSKVNGTVSFKLAMLTDGAKLREFLGVMEWVIQEVEKANQNSGGVI